MFRPLFGNVLIKPVAKQTKTSSGLYLPDTAQEGELLEGEVVATGSGSLASNGEPIEIESGIIPGAHVIYPKWSAKDIQIDGIKHVVIEQREIIGVA